jgi:hypothetical protein
MTLIVIHPTYAEALNLQNLIVSSLGETVDLKRTGLIGDLPGAIGIDEYQRRLEGLRLELKTLPHGNDTSEQFEEIIGNIIRLCFFRSLSNVEPKVRDANGRVVRDWVAGNHASDGFWELVRQRYAATQVIWECKNYADLEADDFQQAAYYMTEPIGKFVVISFRGREKKKHYYEHIRRIANDRKGMVLLFDERDLDVFLRQAIIGKSNQPHIQEQYDHTIRQIS